MEDRLGIAGSTTSRFATEQAHRLLGRLAFQIARTIRSHGAAEVHRLRVAIRRFVRVLEVLKPCFPHGESRKIRRVLKKIRVRAGIVRDHDIALRLLRKLVPSGSGLPLRDLRSAREEACRALLASLKSWMRRNLSARWRGALAGVGSDRSQIQVTASRILSRLAKEFFERGQLIATEKASAGELHRLRVAAKEFRYSLDLFGPLYGESIGPLLERLKGVQTLLGDINDCATVRRILERHPGSREIVNAIKKRQRRKTERFGQEWTACSDPASVREWIGTLSHRGAPNRAVRKPAARAVTTALANRPASA